MSTIAGQPINHRSVPAASRRRWLGTVSAAAIGAVASRLGLSCAQAAQLDLKNLPYIDAHSHVWSPDVERWPLANKQTKDDLKPLSFTPEELLALAEPEGVCRGWRPCVSGTPTRPSSSITLPASASMGQSAKLTSSACAVWQKTSASASNSPLITHSARSSRPMTTSFR